MDLGLAGKKAFVCAASKGLGFASALALAREGCDVLITARDEGRLRDAAATIERETGSRVETLAADLARPADVDAVTQRAAAVLGRVDVLVNNVGGPAPSAAHATGREAWQKGFEQVFLSAALMSRALVGPMRERKFGRIVTITSLSVVEPIDHLVVSTAMRAAVTGFCKTLAHEVAADGVTVNTVMPGVIHTQRIEDLRAAKASRDGTTLERELAQTAATIPAKRLGHPDELAALVAFLASPRAAYITGANIPVDGGLRKGV